MIDLKLFCQPVSCQSHVRIQNQTLSVLICILDTPYLSLFVRSLPFLSVSVSLFLFPLCFYVFLLFLLLCCRINGFHQPNPSYWHFCALRVTEHWSEKSHPPNSAWNINRVVSLRRHIAITVTVSCFTLALLWSVNCLSQLLEFLQLI